MDVGGRRRRGRGAGRASSSPRSAAREGLAFTASAVAIVAAVVLIFGSMYPDVMPAFDPANSLTVTNASSTDYTLTVMTWVAAFLTPLVLLYQGWTYWVFRKRISADRHPRPHRPDLRQAARPERPPRPK